MSYCSLEVVYFDIVKSVFFIFHIFHSYDFLFATLFLAVIRNEIEIEKNEVYVSNSLSIHPQIIINDKHFT